MPRDPGGMSAAVLQRALRRLADLVRQPTTLVFGGSAALLLAGVLGRRTDDGDVIESTPDLGQLQDAVHRVETLEEVAPGWLNGSIQSYLHVLPPDYRGRIAWLPAIGARRTLRVGLLHRLDILVMKVYAARPRDVADLLALVPTPDEIEFIAAQIPRIELREPDKGEAMRAFLREWAARPSRVDPAESSESHGSSGRADAPTPHEPEP